MSPTATYASALRYSVAYRAENSSHSRSQTNAGMPSAWTSSQNSRGRYDSIMVAVDSAGKCSHFVETVTTVTAAGAANLYLRNIWKLHGLPRKVVSDCGPQFVAAFMKELYRLLGIEAATSTAYHPQTDGQTERVNQELEQYLRLFVGERQDDWYTLLPLAEFSYNNHVHSSTQQTPFLLDTGRHPQTHRQATLCRVTRSTERIQCIRGTRSVERHRMPYIEGPTTV